MKNEIAVLAGGCFWGVEELLRKVPGIIDTEVGYTGGRTPNPTYETVKNGSTGHAESIEVTFDPSKITYAQVLDLFFDLHDPTTLNAQGNDRGSQYRSAIFVHDPEQGRIAGEAIQKVNASGRWPRPVVTTIEDLTTFYPAEGYHQDYLMKNPGGYTCHYWRSPRA